MKRHYVKRSFGYWHYLLERHKKSGDANECFFWLHLKLHKGDFVIDTDYKSVSQIVDERKEIIDRAGNDLT